MRSLTRCGFLMLVCGGMILAADRNALPMGLDTQVVLVDETIIHVQDFHWLTAKSDAPKNWLSPIDYAGGTYHVRYEVLEKVNAIPVQIDFCMGKKISADADQRRSIRCEPITKPGVYEVSGAIDSAWDLRGNAKEWNWTDAFAGGLWTDGIPSTMTPPPYPMKVHVTVTIVAKGASYNANGRYGTLDVSRIVLLKPVADALNKGAIGPALAAVLKENDRLAEPPRDQGKNQSDKKIRDGAADEARLAEIHMIIDGLSQYADTRRNELRTIKDSSPEFALEMLIKLGKQYQPTRIGDDILREAKTWNEEPGVKSARESRLLFEEFAHRAERFQERHANFSEVATANRYADDLKYFLLTARTLKTTYPDTPGCRAALALLKTLGIPEEWLERTLAR